MPSTRRSFLGAAAAAAATSGIPLRAADLPSRAPRRANEPRRLMVIGVAGRGAANLNGVKDEQIVALCDIDARNLEQAADRFPDAKTCTDFREVLGDDEQCEQLDGVVISTPDHTHYPAALLALQRGLDVYCEKPLTQTVAQARRLLIAARANRCVTQMGIQIHANENFRRVVEAVRAGAVGAVREVVVFVNGTDWSATSLPKTEDAPDGIAWDAWLGPAQARDYSPGYHPLGWRRYWAFGGGTTADMACHFLDLAFWALQLDAPTSLQADGPEPHAECAPNALRCEYAFPARGGRPELTVRWYAGKDRPNERLDELGLQEWTNGVLFVGDDGFLISDYNKHVVGPAARAAAFTPPKPSIPSSPGHHKEWLDCCRTREQPTCSFDYAVPLTETVLLANAAFRAARGQRVQWNALAMRSDHDDVNALLDVDPREGWPT